MAQRAWLPGEEAVRPVPLGREPTYADIEALEPHLRGEIVAGQLWVLPRPRPLHSLAASVLAGEIGGPFQRGRGGPGGWVILIEPELHLDAPGKPIVPDLAGWRRERLPRLPKTAAIALSPDWVCEVLSPNTEAYDRGPKAETYAHHGVPFLWLVDPDARALEVYRNDAGAWRPAGRYESEAVVRAEPFEAVALELGLLWE